LGGEDTVTAFATGGQGSATALSSTVYNHRVTVCATAGDSVKLPAATVGQDHYVRNDGAASMQVYGQATETIDGVASATGVAQAAGTGVFYVCTTAGKWTRASQLNNPTITGTVSAPQVTGIEIIVAHTAIPFIHISSGSIAANGAISGITALPSAYPRAYCYFPANALATSISAGWYYCTFSTTTAGVAFLDTYTSGVPTIPSSPTAVTDGKGAYTGDITERAGITLTVPAGAMGPNGELIISALFAGTNNANAKTARVRWDGAAGTTWTSINMASNLGLDTRTEIANNGNAAVQTGTSMRISSGSSATQATNYATVNSAVATTVVLSPSKGTATDNIVTEKVSVAVRYGA
jgi:hypothetical protein